MCDKKMEGKRNVLVLKGILIVVGVLAFLYYGVIISILGFRKDFSLIWIVGAFGCFGLFVLIQVLEKNHCEKCSLFVNIILITLSMVVLLFGIMQTIIIRAGYEVPSANADYMIVLGAQVRGETITLALKNRLDVAYEYAMENPKTKVIVSGGQGKGEHVSEAKAMHDYLIQKGLLEKQIIMEAKSTNTNENIMYSKPLLKDADSVVIVTNRFHLYRAKRIAEKQLDMDVQGLGAETGTLLFINYYVREVFATVKDKLVQNI